MPGKEGKVKSGTIEWTTTALVARWEITRRHPDYRTFCDRYAYLFNADGLLIKEARFRPDANAGDGEDTIREAHFLPEAEQIRKSFGLHLIYHYSITFTPETIIEALVFDEALLTAPIPTVEHEIEVEARDEIEGKNTLSVMILSPVTDGHFLEMRVRLSDDASIPQITDEIKRAVAWARETEGVRQDGRRRRTKAIQIISQQGDLLTLKIDVDASDRQLQRELRRLFGATEGKAKARRQGARGSLMASLRFLAESSFRAYDLHQQGLGARKIARRLWPDECRDRSLTVAELAYMREEEGKRLEHKYAHVTKEERARTIQKELDKVGEDWLALRVLEERARKQVIAVKRAISMLDKELCAL
jgi:hypothetical protein